MLAWVNLSSPLRSPSPPRHQTSFSFTWMWAPPRDDLPQPSNPQKPAETKTNGPTPAAPVETSSRSKETRRNRFSLPQRPFLSNVTSTKRRQLSAVDGRMSAMADTSSLRLWMHGDLVKVNLRRYRTVNEHIPITDILQVARVHNMPIRHRSLPIVCCR